MLYESFFEYVEPGEPPSFAASAEKILNFSHHFWHSGEFSGQICDILNFQFEKVFGVPNMFFYHFAMF